MSTPVALGYVRLTPGAAAMSVAAGIAGLEAFADARGWRLGEVFVDDEPGRPLLAWASLSTVSRGLRLAAVLVPDAPGLRPGALVVERLRLRCAREIGAPLLLAPVDPGGGASVRSPDAGPSGVGWTW